MHKLRELEIFRESEAISDQVWKHVAGWDSFPRDTLGLELVTSIDAINTNIAESHSHKSHHGRLHYLYTARGSLFKSLILLEKAARRELGMVRDFSAALERLMPQMDEYIAASERDAA